MMIIPQEKIKDKPLDYLDGMSQGILLATQMINRYFKEPFNIVSDLDDAWDEIMAEEDRQLDIMHEALMEKAPIEKEVLDGDERRGEE